MCDLAIWPFFFIIIIIIIINDWKCSAKEAASWKEPHGGTYVINKYIDRNKEIFGYSSFYICQNCVEDLTSCRKHNKL